MIEDHPDVIAIDVGGSSVKSAVFSAGAGGSARGSLVRLPTVPIHGRRFDAVRVAVLSAVDHARSRTDADLVGLSTTGTVDPHGIVVHAGHFTGYDGTDWGPLLKRQFRSLGTVSVVNDGKASAWAEYSTLGQPGSGHVHFVLGTGVGSSLILHGSIVDGDSGEAGALGHSRVTSDATMVCGTCRRQGCLETVASGPGLVYEYNQRARASLGGFSDYQEALARGDEVAGRVVANACSAFGAVLAPVVNALNPRNVTFGGGVLIGLRQAMGALGDPDLLLADVRAALVLNAFPGAARSTNLMYGSLDNDGGLIGAALLALRAATRT